MTDNAYPRFQWSGFKSGDRGEQLVVRGEDLIQFAQDVDDVRQSFNAPIKAATPKPVPEDNTDVYCKICGATTSYREGVAKSTGKPWKGYFCTESREHKPFFLK